MNPKTRAAAGLPVALMAVAILAACTTSQDNSGHWTISESRQHFNTMLDDYNSANTAANTSMSSTPSFSDLTGYATLNALR